MAVDVLSVSRASWTTADLRLVGRAAWAGRRLSAIYRGIAQSDAYHNHTESQLSDKLFLRSTLGLLAKSVAAGFAMSAQPRAVLPMTMLFPTLILLDLCSAFTDLCNDLVRTVDWELAAAQRLRVSLLHCQAMANRHGVSVSEAATLPGFGPATSLVAMSCFLGLISAPQQLLRGVIRVATQQSASVQHLVAVGRGIAAALKWLNRRGTHTHEAAGSFVQRLFQVVSMARGAPVAFHSAMGFIFGVIHRQYPDSAVQGVLAGIADNWWFHHCKLHLVAGFRATASSVPTSIPTDQASRLLLTAIRKRPRTTTQAYQVRCLAACVEVPVASAEVVCKGLLGAIGSLSGGAQQYLVEAVLQLGVVASCSSIPIPSDAGTALLWSRRLTPEHLWHGHAQLEKVFTQCCASETDVLLVVAAFLWQLIARNPHADLVACRSLLSVPAQSLVRSLLKRAAAWSRNVQSESQSVSSLLMCLR